ncbi:MAG: hypothetical protein COZ56_08935 [Armatimonadetes bacterium CG_4_8_14_3_um_filter_58_9]|nr:MAG: hypothetical protein COZ56_08935 [Armatimonadetes bacterium CG_4_8_14_3_um_filter_58_9]
MASNQTGTFETIILEASCLLQPLADACQGGIAGVSALMAESGLDLDRLLEPGGVAKLEGIANNLQGLYGALRSIAEAGEVESSQIIELLRQLAQMLDAVDALNGLQLKNDVPAELQNLGKQLLDYLVIRYLRTAHPALYYAFLLVGVIDPGGREDQFFPAVIYSRVPRLFTDLPATAREVYGWGTDDFDADSLLIRLRGLLWYLGIPVQFAHEEPGASMDDTIASARLPLHQLRLPLLTLDREGTSGDVGLTLLRLSRSAAGSPGLGVVPFGMISVAEELDAGDGWHIRLSGSAEALAPFGISVRPEGILIGSLGGAVSPPKVIFRILVERRAPPGTHSILFGSTDGTRVELGSIGVQVGLEVGDRLDLFVELPVKELRLIIAAGEGDGFLNTLLPEDGITASFDLTLGYSWKQGVYFSGSGGLEIAIPSHISLGPIDIDALTIGAKLANGGLRFTAGATIRATLGPLQASVENLGLAVDSKFLDGGGGGIGPLDLSIGFKPPKGVGLAIDASAVKGGGYLYFDFDKEEYAGVMELSIANFLTLTAVGLVTTRMPDSSKGFSLLIIITAEFGTGIQIGMGFTLIGVGGLLGLNRTVKLQPLADGVRTGAVNNIMFPKNVVANAPRIISDLRTIFPPFEGKFLIGPMAKLGWGSPPLITLSLGVIIEIPGNLAILGVLKCILPDEKAPILVLQVAFVGAIEFDKKRLWLFASIFDSRVLTFTLEGEIGVLFAWGDDANFVLSVGGFHPRFIPPPLPFPSPKRLAICILDKDQARIRVACYFAVTTNTVQFGASAELYFGLGPISVEGSFHFDALFQFSPFYFVIELGASVSLKVGGTGVFSISLDLALEGPTPWHAKGRGSISFFFFDITANFDETWGQEQDTTLPPIDVFPVLAEELAKEPNWSALPPKSGNLLVSLRVVGETKEFVMHPVGTLRVTQRAVPLNSTIDLFGTQKPTMYNHFTLDVSLDAKTKGLGIANPVREEFAPAQFHAMSRDKKLSAPAFAKEDGGVDISATGNQLRSSLVVRRIVRYEQIIIDTNYKRFKKRFVDFSGALFHHFLGGNAAARSPLSARLKNQMQPFKDVIKTDTEWFGVAYTSNNTIVAGTSVFGSYHAAEEYMQQAVVQKPELAGTMHVVPQFELRKAA